METAATTDTATWGNIEVDLKPTKEFFFLVVFIFTVWFLFLLAKKFWL